jgi:transcriptional regulator with XRE-family HTH domain
MAASAYDQAIGQRLRRLREERGWSMAQLAKRCSGAGVTASQINKLEKGSQQFSASWLYRLAAALECPVTRLIVNRAEAEFEGHQSTVITSGMAEPDHRFIARITEPPEKDGEP